MGELATPLRNSIGSLIGSVHVHEGDKLTTVREDGSSDTSGFRTSEIEVTLAASDLEHSGTTAIREAMRTVQEGVARNQTDLFVDVMNQACSVAGTSVDGR